jgi:hypothetical protein
MRVLFTLALWGVLCSSTPEKTIQDGNTRVYICTGNNAYRYHNNGNCRGLDNCCAEIKSVSLEYAKSIGRSPCKICY